MKEDSGSSFFQKFELNRCLGCGQALEDSDESCGTCGMDIHLLQEIRAVHSQPRFLFGRVELPLPDEPVEEPPERRKADSIPVEDVTLTKGEEIAQIPADSLPNGHEFDTSFLESETEGPGYKKKPLSTIQPNQAENVREQGETFGFRIAVIFLDCLFLLLLNSLVAMTLVWQTSSGFVALVKHSFLPVILVHLAFSGIYFYLFSRYFGRLPGRIFMNRKNSGRGKNS